MARRGRRSGAKVMAPLARRYRIRHARFLPRAATEADVVRCMVLGAGLQGSACAYDLLRHREVEAVTLVDTRFDRMGPFLKPFVGRKLTTTKLDVRDDTAVREALAGHNAALCALPYYFNLPLSEAALDAGVHFADLGGNTEIVFQQKELHERALERGVSIVPDCGLAPGMVNILAAEGIHRLDRVETVKVYVGGLPQRPEPPLNYQIVYSLEGVLDYYTTPSWVLRSGRPARVEALSEVERVMFPAPVGELEAFHTGGGISTLPWKYDGRVPVMEYKTLRYPGHADIMRTIRDLGLLDLAPLKVKGKEIVPRDVFIAVVSPKLTKPEGRDLVAMRVEVAGLKAAEPTRIAWQLLDYYDEVNGLSAMERTTGFSLAVTGIMLGDGRVEARGVHTPDEAVPYAPYVEELARRGVDIREV